MQVSCPFHFFLVLFRKKRQYNSWRTKETKPFPLSVVLIVVAAFTLRVRYDSFSLSVNKIGLEFRCWLAFLCVRSFFSADSSSYTCFFFVWLLLFRLYFGCFLSFSFCFVSDLLPLGRSRRLRGAVKQHTAHKRQLHHRRHHRLQRLQR